jgi:LPPG:FO 2-phospho-L-lactate transferase
MLASSGVPLIAVSPIIAGQAVKGPAARMLQSLGKDVSVVGVADVYSDLNMTLVIDEADKDLASAVADRGVKPVVAPILMTTREDRRALARVVLALAAKEADRHNKTVAESTIAARGSV